MKILSASQVRALDSHTIASEPIRSIDLMERASKAFVSRFCKGYDNKNKVLVIAGTGNNGGDALAISRLLFDKGYSISLFIIGDLEKSTDDFKTNHGRLPDSISMLSNIDHIISTTIDVIIDGIFGSGLSRRVDRDSEYGQLIARINSFERPIVSIDISSGLFADQITTDSEVISATQTISFQLPKLAFMMPENHRFVGDWEIVDIGLDEDFIAKSETNYNYLTTGDIKPWVPERSKFDHKGNFGRGLLVAGGLGKMGAAIMAAESYLRSGGSLLSVVAPGIGMDSLHTRLPEAMFIQAGQDFIDRIDVDLAKIDAIGIGPGIGTEEATGIALKDFMKTISQPIVIDADALNLISENKDLQEMIPVNSILTPHLGEFDRLAGPSSNHFERIEKLRSLAEQLECIIVLKGAHTAISDPSGIVFFNSTGNEGMATGGSGDILTGLITSFLGQTKRPLDSALLGVYFHGLAGDFSATALGKESMIATDIIKHFGDSYRYLAEN